MQECLLRPVREDDPAKRQPASPDSSTSSAVTATSLDESRRSAVPAVTWPRPGSSSNSSGRTVAATSSRRVLGEADQEHQPSHCLLVAPLQVVKHEQGRPIGGEDRPGQPLEESVPLPGVDHRSGGARRRAGAHFRDRPARLDPRFRSRRHGPGRAPAARPRTATSAPSTATADRKSLLRSHSATGASARPAGQSEATCRRHDRPLGASHVRQLHATSRLFPTPASPDTTPARTARSLACCHRCSSRPTSLPPAHQDRPGNVQPPRREAVAEPVVSPRA